MWVLMQLFMYVNGDAMYFASRFISDTGILYPVEQSFFELLGVFNTSSVFILQR